MARIIAITNQKGGVAKTTTAVNLGACLARLGKRVLLVDSDPQGNATSGLGIEKHNLSECYYDVLINGKSLDDTLKETPVPGLVLVPSTLQLAGAEVEMVAMERREYRAREVLRAVQNRYDYLLIDCPPSLGLLTVNALTAADTYLIPVQAEYYALEGLTLLLRTIETIRRTTNPRLRVEGVLVTLFDRRTNLSSMVESEVRAYFREKTYRTVIPKSIRLAEAPSYGLPACLYEGSSSGALAYDELAKEVIASG